MTVKELEENLKEGVVTASGSSKKNLAHAKVVGIACDVCEADDVRKLANFAVDKLGYIDIWVRAKPFTIVVCSVDLGWFPHCRSLSQTKSEKS